MFMHDQVTIIHMAAATNVETVQNGKGGGLIVVDLHLNLLIMLSEATMFRIYSSTKMLCEST